MTYSSRSRLLEFQKCPRSGFYKYHYLGKGIEPDRKSIYLVTGLAVHQGLEILLGIAQKNFAMLKENLGSIASNARQKAGEAFDSLVKDRGIENHQQGKTSEIRQEIDTILLAEQRCLVEAIVYAFGAYVLPCLLDRFTVEMVERELSYEFNSIIWEGRVDAVLKEISTGNVYVLSFKTAADYSVKIENKGKTDMQGISETFLLQEYLKTLKINHDGIAATLAKCADSNVSERDQGILKKAHKFLAGVPSLGPDVTGVKMFYLIKGEKRWTKLGETEDGEEYGYKATQSPLIRGWQKVGAFETEWAHSYYYPNPNNKSGKSRLGKGWEGFNLWDVELELPEGKNRVEWWVDLLAQGQVQPECGEVVKDCFIEPLENDRDKVEQENWLEQMRAQEDVIVKEVKAVEESLGGEKYFSVLNTYFPQFERSCDWPLQCDNWLLCWGEAEVKSDPIGSGLYRIREPHHEREIKGE